MTEPLFRVRDGLDCGLAGGVARASGCEPAQSHSPALAGLQRRWWRPSSRATTAGLWLCWPGSAIGLVLLRRGQLRSRAFWLASALVVAAPMAWFVYNAVGLRRLARLCARTLLGQGHRAAHRRAGAGPPHPGWHNPWVSLLFFVKAAEMDAAAAAWGNVLLASACWERRGPGSSRAAARSPGRCCCGCRFPSMRIPWPTARCPSFLPAWWPHSWYNTRYGMEMLPAFALGLGFAAHFALAAVREFKPQWATLCGGRAVCAWSLSNAWQDGARASAGLRRRNQEHRGAPALSNRQIPPVLRALLAKRPGGVVLMETSVYPETCRVHRNSSAADDQRERSGVLSTPRWPRRPPTRPSCWPSTATRSTAR